MPAVVATLTEEEILAIHYRVCADFSSDDDPVGIAGPREDGRHLSSVVARQHVGFGSYTKYSDPIENAATLTFGICCGHPFNNGNKRTALIAMLAHLDRNGFTLFGVKQKELYDMIKAVAQHRLGVRADPRKKDRGYTPREVDDEVRAIAAWIRRSARPLRRGEHLITYRELRRLLADRGFILDKPKNNSIGIYREIEVKRGLLKNKIRLEQKHIGTIPYPGDGKVVGHKLIKQVRRACHLDEAHGCDTSAFYDGTDVIDAFVNEYRSILARLARE